MRQLKIKFKYLTNARIIKEIVLMENNRIKETVKKQRAYFNSGKTKDVLLRKDSLKKLREAILKYEAEINQSLKKDLNKSVFESYATEIGMVLHELHLSIKNIKKWAKPKKVSGTLTQFPSKSYIYPEPYGVVLIIAPWNYPFQLTLMPLIGAITAGNCVIMKTSSAAPHTHNIVKKIIEDVFSDEYIAVFEGGSANNQAIMEERYDFIFFTGGTDTAKIVMEKAAKNLTPLILELGGKSPCIVHQDAKIKQAAKRIAWGKFLNAGQTCISPDYLLVQKGVKSALLEAMQHEIELFYGQNPKESQDYCRIINLAQYTRLIKLLDTGTIFSGGQYDDNSLYISPTILDNIKMDDTIMREEIFGPILPVIEYETIEEALLLIRHLEKPLSLYLFTTNKKIEAKILKDISFGGGCINDTVVHIINPALPFGGVGFSGLGKYHGKTSFDSFSHKKSLLKKSNWIDLPFRYPPYKKFYLKLLKKILK